MTFDINLSPVGWYYASYLLRFVEMADPDKNRDDKPFSTWENTVLVQAKDMDEAHAKVTALARKQTAIYRGGREGVRVRWKFVGITELLPVYDPIEDGVEIAWTDHGDRKLKDSKSWVKPKRAFFRKRRVCRD